jgi:hypothetical protein
LAITLTKLTSSAYSTGARFRTLYKLALDSSYVTGGYVIKSTDLGFSVGQASDPEFLVEVDNLNGYGFQYDYTNQKLILYATAGAQVGGAVDLSAVNNARISAVGRWLL